jgi:hypothetical protein
LSLAIVGEIGARDVVVASVVVELATVEDEELVASVDVDVASVDVELASDAVGAVVVLSVGLPPTEVIPRAPDTVAPARNNAVSARTIPLRRKPFRPFISPALLLPQIRRAMKDPSLVKAGRASPSRAFP